ncbi:hypothetical protein HDV01_000068 [Terramyces sp. JEL0728]|nr:hypothetical protein HDV01_000068 [Terramyces sp. JEL0728]
MESLFKPLILYPDRKGFNSRVLELLLKRFKAYGGKTGTLDEADIVLSKNKFSKPTVDADWISNSITSKKRLPITKSEVDLVVIDDDHKDNSSKRKAEVNYDSETDKSDSDIEVVKSEKKPKFDQKKFVCMSSSKSTAPPQVPNQGVIDQLQKLLDRYTIEGDRWRVKSYRTAISALKKYPTKIKDRKEALAINGIGEKIADKIQEFLDIGYVKKTKETPENIKSLEIFYNIYGVGSKLAQKWYSEGMRTLDDIKKRTDLTKAQQLGIKHYHDLMKRISRKEVKEIGNRIEKVVKERFPELEMYIMGSYRRGAETCGDIDLIFTSKTFELSEQVFTEICDQLTAAKIMTDTIIVASEIVRGICSIDNGPQRRIAVMEGRKKVSVGERVAGETEEGVFKILGVPYRPPTERNA